MKSNSINTLIRFTFIAICLALFVNFPLLSSNNSKLEEARLLYYSAIDEEDNIEKAIKIFEEIISKDRSLKGLSITYIGSLTAMKAAHTFWPNNKLDYVNEGLEIMEEGVALSPNNIEALFIQGTTLYNLPFFFGTSDDAESNFKKIINLLNDKSITEYDHEILSKTIDFILENAELTDQEKKKARKFRQKLPK